jgi:hypothetical protein
VAGMPTTTPPPICVTVDQAAAMVGLSAQAIRRAILQGELSARYPTSRPVIMIEELHAWVDASTTRKPPRTA